MNEPIYATRIETPDSVLDDLRSKLRAAGSSKECLDDAGARERRERVRRFCAYWAEKYDWRATQARLNAWPQFETEIDGQKIHFFWIRTAETRRIPLLLTHGMPGSVAEFLDLIDPLISPSAHNASGELAFDVVMPSLPDWVRSTQAVESAWSSMRTAAIWRELMRRLGYGRFGAHGSGYGSIILARLVLLAPEDVIGIHLTNVLPPPSARQSGPGKSLQGSYDESFSVQDPYPIAEACSANLSSGKLDDSPIALATWMLDKVDEAAGGGDDSPRVLDTNRLLDTLSVCWLTRRLIPSVGSNLQGALGSNLNGAGANERNPTPATYPNHLPENWVEQALQLVHYRQMPRLGLFPAIVAPELLGSDLREFFGSIDL